MLVYVARLINMKPASYFGQVDVRNKIGALYLHLGLSRMQLHYATFFFARRLYLVLVLTGTRTPMIKVELISLSCFAAIYYCMEYSPFADSSDTRLEIFNEVCLLVANTW